MNGLCGNLDSLTVENEQDTDAMQRIANFVDNMRFADDERRCREGTGSSTRFRSEVVIPKTANPDGNGAV